MKQLTRVVGLNMACQTTLPCIWSMTSVDPTFSDLIRAAARAFSSGVSQLACSGDSGKRK